MITQSPPKLRIRSTSCALGWKSIRAREARCSSSSILHSGHMTVSPLTLGGLQACLSFYEKRKRQNWLGIGGNQEERLIWEQW